MHSRILLPAMGLWLVMMVLAVLNGAFREFVISPRLGPQAGHVISTIILMLLIVALTFLFIARYKGRYSSSDMLVMGAAWLILTVSFEFGLGYARGMPWEQMLADYNVLRGRIWIVIPLTIFFAPYIIYRLLNRS